MGEYVGVHGELVKLAEVASEHAPETVERSLAAAREELGMDVAFASEFTEERMVFRQLVGDAARDSIPPECLDELPRTPFARTSVSSARVPDSQR